MLIRFENDFHNTAASVRVRSWGSKITRRQLENLERRLCGMAECSCSDATGVRGLQPKTDGYQHTIDLDDHNLEYSRIEKTNAEVAVVDAFDGATWQSDRKG